MKDTDTPEEPILPSMPLSPRRPRPPQAREALQKPTSDIPVVPDTVLKPIEPETIEAPNINIEGMLVDELIRLRTKVDERIRQIHEATENDIIKQIVDVVAEHKIPTAKLIAALSDGLNAKSGRQKSLPRYRDPESGATWTGRGRAPSWIPEKNRDDFLISR